MPSFHLSDDIFLSEIVLSIKDLLTIGFPHISDRGAPAISPMIALRLAALCECFKYFHQISNIIFLHAPMFFRDFRF